MLPQLKTPTYSGTIPSTNDSFEFRPFLVGEQKVLLLAMETNDEKQLYIAFRDTLRTCVIGPESIKNNIEKLPLFDLESIFLQISSKSTGDVSKIAATCTHCGTSNTLSVRASDVELKQYEKGKTRIELTESVGLVMRYPTLETVIDSVKDQTSDNVDQNNDSSDFYQSIADSIESIYDENEVYLREDINEKELSDFVDSLSLSQLKKIESFFDEMPYLGSSVNFKCTECGSKNVVELKGIRDFF